MAKNIGIDLGGTNIKGAVIDSENGEILFMQKIPTDAHEGHEKVIARIVKLCKSLVSSAGLRMEDISGIGIGLPGAINAKTGSSIFMTNLPDHWINVPVCDLITKGTGKPAFLINDVNSITWGEQVFGAGKGTGNMVCFALGTGIGGGLVVNGQLILGRTGVAGELGHMIVQPHGNRCNCGAHGCLETYASGPAIRSMALKAVAHGGTTILGEMVDYDLNKITPKTVSDAALRGDEMALEIYATAGYYLGIAVANIITVFDPDKIIIAGGVSAAGELLMKPIRDYVYNNVRVTPLEGIQISNGELGNEAGVYGASMWADFNMKLQLPVTG